jgi:UDP-galactopyranose mutase
VIPDIVCFSHLRWDFVYQRPNHLMSRAAKDGRVYFVEEPQFGWDRGPSLTRTDRDGVVVVTPRLPETRDHATTTGSLARLMEALADSEGLAAPILWYYTPMALPWTRHLAGSLTVYDSMDYLSGFLGAPTELSALESELLSRADVVFTGGAQLHQRMASRHPAAHCFPSSVDVAHFATARSRRREPADQATVAHPRLGYAGVIDERIDLELIRDVAARRPDWQIVLLGPVVKIDPRSVPSGPNVHALGIKPYSALPAYLSGWDAGWMPFARNEATRYISPTKTPEYLAAGLGVVSTGIADVVDPYGQLGLVEIANDPTETVAAFERVLATDVVRHRQLADSFLSERSWDRTWTEMRARLEETLIRPTSAAPASGRTRPVRSASGRRRHVADDTPIATPAARRGVSPD